MKRRGCTRTDVVSTMVVFCCGLSAAAVATLGGQPGKPSVKDGTPPSRTALLAKDQQHLRGIGQAMVIWAQNNAESFPLPSAFDIKNQTITTPGRGKDTTSHIMSMLLFNGFVPPEMLISPVERNRRIKVEDKYAYTNPPKAVDPQLALWDPAFSADFTSSGGGSVSYAHLQPAGGRLARWKSWDIGPAPLLANRGPEIAEIKPNDNGEFGTYLRNLDAHSMRLWESPLPGSDEEVEGKVAFRGGDAGTDGGPAEKGEPADAALKDASAARAWSGHILAMDMSARFHKDLIRHTARVNPLDRRYETREHSTRPDSVFFDEPEDPRSVNDYLGIFTRAGESPTDYSAIWD